MPTPKPLPTALKLLKGNAGRRPISDKEPKPEVLMPDPPHTLCEEGREVWAMLVKPLAKLRVMTEMDLSALEMLCDAEVRYRAAMKATRAVDGLIDETESGYKQQSAWLLVANKAFDQKLKILTEFGMTPSSRTKIQVETKTDDDPLGALMKKHKQ